MEDNLLIRKCLIGGVICGCHALQTIKHDAMAESTFVQVCSYQQRADIDGGAGIVSEHAHPLDDSLTFDAALAWIASLPEFAEYDEGEVQGKLDEVLEILTDEQAEQVPDAFRVWAPDTQYSVGDRRRYSGILYKCIQAHTSQEGWEPPNVPALWVRIGEPGDIPDWVQPTGAHDAYNVGDKVKHNGKVWESEIDSNVYEPGVYGWKEVN